MTHATDDDVTAETRDKATLSPILRLLIPLIASLTLGLAPFASEPHIIGKLRWVAGGADGMALMDWADLAMHGAPWIWLLVAIGLVIRDKSRG